MKSLIAVMLGAILMFASVARAADPLWTTDWPAYVAEQGARSVIRGVSPSPEPTEAEATTSAEADAADTLVNKVRAAMGRRGKPIGDAELRSAIISTMQRDALIVERHVSPVVRPYATIWTAQVLVDTSPASMKKLIDRASAERRFARESIAARAVLIACGTAAVFLSYLLVNSLTRGYFIGRLRFTAVALVAVGASLIVAIV